MGLSSFSIPARLGERSFFRPRATSALDVEIPRVPEGVPTRSRCGSDAGRGPETAKRKQSIFLTVEAVK
jgi:hypothetical protein